MFIVVLGECWSGGSAYENFKKHGVSTKCVDNNFKECKKDGPVCTGTASTNYVYRIAPTCKCFLLIFFAFLQFVAH